MSSTTAYQYNCNGQKYLFNSPMYFPQDNLDHLPEYYVREPLGKRTAIFSEEDMCEEGAPRAKRRFDKVTSGLQNFSISGTGTVNLDFSDDDMENEDSTPSPSQVEAIVEEPDEPPKRIKLDDRMYNYLRAARERDILLPQSVHKIRGNELVIYREPRLPNPLDDPTMRGRIFEIDPSEQEELPDDVAQEVVFPDDSSQSDTASMTPNSSSSSPPLIQEVLTEDVSDMTSSSQTGTDDDMDID